ncbi:MAG: Verru_Chthon cassette protein D [Verrucomicrobiae bacterium]|nr:Verru_Chthon cassette protein D [Verrucomicrobiae bacterium]
MRKDGFSLVEMLIVLTVLGILMALAAPNLFTLMQSSTLSSEGNLVRNKLAQAQQLALSKNSDIEVRFFEMADPSAAEQEDEFRGFQFFQFNDLGKLMPISKFYRIKPPVVISKEQSTLLNPGSNKDAEGKEYGFLSPSEGTYPVPVGDDQIDATYISFRFRPDGSTDLPGRTGSDDTWYLTLLQGDNPRGELPANYYIVQLDAFNGRVSVFRP